MNIKRLFSCIILSLLLLANMTLIFYNSSLDSDLSNSMSTDIATVIYNQTEKTNVSSGKTDSEEKTSLDNVQTSSAPETLEQKKEREAKEKAQAEEEHLRSHKIMNYNTRLRSMLHFVEFMSLSFLLALLLSVLTMSRSYINMAISAVFGAIYAFSDEVHQIFVDGRSFEISDLLIDFTGVAAGVLFASILFILCRRFLTNKN